MLKDITKQVEKLKTYRGSSSPILSIYFQLPIPKIYSNETILNKLQSHINANLSLDERKFMQENIQMIAGFMKDYQQQRGEATLAFFTGGNNFFEVMHLPFKYKSTVVLDHSPYLNPILDSQSENYRYLVIVTDKKNALFYTLHAGVVEDKESLFNDKVPPNIRHIGSDGLRTQRENKLEKRIQEHVHKHFSYIAQRAKEFIADRKVAGVILGGHKNEIGLFREHLPKSLRDKVLGNFVSEFHTSFDDILQRSKHVIEDVSAQNHRTALI